MIVIKDIANGTFIETYAEDVFINRQRKACTES